MKISNLFFTVGTIIALLICSPVTFASQIEQDIAKPPSSIQQPNLADRDWMNRRDALIYQKKMVISNKTTIDVNSISSTEGPSGSNVLIVPLYSAGKEDFEGDFPGSYWYVGDDNPSGGSVYWDDVSCKSKAGSWSGWCADIGGPATDCTEYVDYMDAYMYVECDYLGTTGSGTNKLYYARWVQVETCCDYLHGKIQGYINNPGHGIDGTPDAEGTWTLSGNSSDWEDRVITLNSAFDACYYLRITFYFHSDSTVHNYQGAYLDEIEFNNRSDTAIYPISGGFPSSAEADLALQNLTVSRSGELLRTFTACGFDIKNNGPAALSSESIMVDYYLSDDTTFGDADDRQIGDTGFTVSIASGATYHIDLSSDPGLINMVDLWTACLVPNGNYYVFAKVRLTSPPPTDPAPGNDYGRTSSTFIYNGCTTYGVTITLCTISNTTPNPNQSVTLSGTAGQVRGMSNSDLIKVVIGFRNGSGNWAGGEPVVVSSTVPGLSWQPWSGSSAIINAPSNPGTYYVWVRSVPTVDNATAIQDFKNATPTSADEERNDKWGTVVTVTSPVNLLEAVDASGFNSITTGTSAPWFGQTTTYYYGEDAAQSADIGDGGESYIYITVTGPGTIQFYWNVSSEAGWDYLEFYDGATRLDQISGTVNWTEKVFSIGSGSHTLKWRYVKDGSLSSGSDCGWVDYVRWVATPPDIRIEPLTLDFSSTIVSSTISRQAGVSSIYRQDGSKIAALDISDPNAELGEIDSNEIIVRFRTAEAASLHVHRITRGISAAQWINGAIVENLETLPSEVLGLRAFVSGSDKAWRVAISNEKVRTPLLNGNSLAEEEIIYLKEDIQAAAAERDGPVGLFYAKITNGADPREVCLKLSSRADVVYAHPSPICRVEDIPNDTLYSRMWNLNRIGMPAAWDVSGNILGGVRVCVMDTGVRITHNELVGRTDDPTDVYLSNGDAYADSDPDNDDPSGHGTSCAGIIAAIRDNGSLVAGIAPVTIIPVNGYGDDGYIYNYTDGVFWGVDHNADVISLSIGSHHSAPYQAELDAANYAENHGVVVCAAAGNEDGNADDHYPSAIPYYISVAAVDDDDLRVTQPKWWWGSNFGNTVDISALGQGDVGASSDSILTLNRGSDTDWTNSFNGTSAATPHVAGLCALLRHVNTTLTAVQIRDIIESTAEDQIGDPSEDTLGWDQFHGHGLINATAAVAAANGGQTFTVYNDGTGDLDVTNITKQSGSCWLDFSPSAFTVSAGASQVVTVTVDTSCVPPGTYSNRLLVYSNDPDESPYPGGVYVDLTITCTPPQITDQPDSQTVCVGQDAVFNVVATGTEPLHYQWKKDGVYVGSDSSALTLYGVQLSDDGSEIWCEVTNGCGSQVTSSTALLTVFPWPTVTINPNPDQLNAAWTLDGPNGYTYSSNGDETIAELEFGSYTITWSTIPSWNTPLPNPDTKNLSIGNSINFIGNYQLIADLNNDYSVDIEDLGILVSYWLTFEPSINMSGDDFIDFSDFAVLAEHWLEGI
jgi:hypothetical protein